MNPPHRVKSISMTTFSEAEIELLKKGGNEVIEWVECRLNIFVLAAMLFIVSGLYLGGSVGEHSLPLDFMCNKSI